MKILIVSDTHHRHTSLKKILQLEKPFDCMIHLGDVEGCEELIQDMAGCPTYMVSGNNDFFCDLPREEEIMLGKYKVLLTHGHYYYVSLDLQEIKRQGAARGVDIVMFGHTHRPLIEKSEALILLNPGSLSYPRQEGRQPSYIVMEIDKQGEAHYEIRYA